MRTILVQGAVQEEIEQLINNLPGGNWSKKDMHFTKHLSKR